MSKHFEHDDLLKELKMASKKKPAPKLAEQVLINATVDSGDRKSVFVQISKKPVSWLSGLVAIAAIVGITLSLSTSTNASKNGTGSASGVLSANSFKLNLTHSKNPSSSADRIWVPDVIATAGPNISNEASGSGPLYEGVSPTSPEKYAKFLANYFGVDGELTTEKAFLVEDEAKTVEFYQIYDQVKKIKVTVSKKDEGGIGFSVSFPFESDSKPAISLSDAKDKMTKLLQDLVLSKSDPSYPAIQLSDVEVTQGFHYIRANANQLVQGSEINSVFSINSGFSANFFENGQLDTLSGSLAQFIYKGAIPTVSEADAITRLGSYWHNPYRVQSAEDLHAVDYCDNSLTLGGQWKCETIVDKVVQGTSVFYDRDRKVWVGPTYTMYHKGHRIGEVLAINSDYLIVNDK